MDCQHTDTDTEYTKSGRITRCGNRECRKIIKREKIATIECPACHEWCEKEDFEENSRYANILEDYICRGCAESEEEHQSTIVKWDGSEKEVVRYGKYDARSEDGDDPPKWFWDIFVERKWESTDAWRGYYETKWRGHLVKLAEGWITGYPDKTISHKQKSYDLNDLLERDDIFLERPLFWSFEQTSNVFSTASEVFCYEEDKPTIKKWLKKHGITLEELEEAFG
jgi:hypothetical protein